MKQFLSILLAVSASAIVAMAAAKPNIILIIADDLGCEDCGPYGNKGVRTPNLDRLAREGMRFTRAFNTCSSCSPSRSSIITGRYPHSTGAERLHIPLPKAQVTFVEKLKAAGYWTAAAGKWHLGPLVKDRFDVVHEGDKAVDGVKPDGSGCTQWLPTLRGRPRDKPFFFWLASIDPHRPYFEGTLKVPHKPEETEVPPFLPDAQPTRKDLAMYYDEIGRLDIYAGKVLAELERQGVLDQTAIFFITDNGRPFPRCKTSVYDSGIQSPLLVRWPGRVSPGSLCASLVSSVDLAPTLLALAGLPAEPTFQGKSFAPLLADPTGTVREYVFAEHNWHDYTAHERSVRNVRFKYIRNSWPELPGTPPADAVSGLTFQEMRRRRDLGRLTPEQMVCFVKPRPAEELYDVQTDPQELRNLAGDAKQVKTLKELRSVLDQWQRETADFVPAPRPPDTFDRETGEPLGKKESASPAGLSVEKGRFMKDGRAYRGVGANYFDLFLRVLHNSNDLSSCEGLKKLSEAGIPFVRFGAGGFSAEEWRVWMENKERYFRSMDVVVKAAEEAKIGLIPSLFWTQIFPDLAGEPRDQWGNPDSKTMALMRQYVADVVGRYKDSPAIWAWEFGNEMSLAADLPNAAQFRKKGGTERDDLKSEHLVVALSEFAKAVRRLDAHRAIISGNSHPRLSAWHNTRERSWKPDSREQTLEIILRDNPAPLDTIGIHFYGDREVQKEAGAWAKDSVDYLRAVKGVAKKSGRPVFIGEFGLAASGDETKTRAVFEGLLAAMESAEIDLAAFWVFDLAAQDKDWNVTFDNSRAYMIKLSSEANRRWNAAAITTK